LKKELLLQLRKRLKLNHKTAIFILCVILASVFWVFTSLSKEYETQITIPVNYRNIPFTKYFDSELPKELEYHFRGTGFRLARVHFRNRPDSIIVDVSAHSNQKQQLQFQTIALKNQFPGEFKPYKITPENITAGFNSRLSKKVPVRLISQISFRSRFQPIGPMQLLPDSIELAGPAELLAKISEVKTTRLNAIDVSSSKKGRIHLDSSTYAGLASSTSEILYYLPVEEFTEGVMEIPVELPVSQRSRVMIMPGTVKVTFAAALSDFPDIKNIDFRIETEVPVSDLPSKLAVRVRKQPASVRIIRIEPEFLDYLVQK